MISSAPSLKYGDNVKMKDKNSKYRNITGKITNIAPLSAVVKFEGIKKTVSIMLDALERT